MSDIPTPTEQAFDLVLSGAGDSEVKEQAGIGEKKLRSVKRELAAANKIVSRSPEVRTKLAQVMDMLAQEQQEYLDRLNRQLGETDDPQEERQILKAREQARILQARIYAGDGSREK